MKTLYIIILCIVVGMIILMWILRKAKITELIDGDSCIRFGQTGKKAFCFKEIKTEGVTTSVLAYANQSTGRKVGFELPRFMTPIILSDENYLAPQKIKVEV